MRVGPGQLEWWLDYYSTLKWTFAESYAETAPHHYVVRGRSIGWKEGAVVLGLVRTFGDPQKYWSNMNLYLVRDGVKWWFDWRWEPMKEVKVINMAAEDQFFGIQDAPVTRSGHFSVYDTLCMEYDDLVGGPHDEQIKEIIAEHLKIPAPKVLDIGAGTGRGLDLELTPPGRMVVVDPSQGMLNTLLRKHHFPPRRKVGDVLATRIEDVYENFVPGEFDLVLGLYGSPSYVYPGVVEMLPELGQLTVLMTYKPGYLPAWWRGWELPPNTESVAATVARMGGLRYDLGNFDLTVIKNDMRLF